jgi:AraC-like DNA-binding protein
MRHRRWLEEAELPGRTVARRVWTRDGITLFEERSEYEPFPWCAPSLTTDWGVVLPRYGVYARRTNGVEHVVDVNTGFIRRPLDESSIAVMVEQPDELTILDIDEAVLDELPGVTGATGPLRISPQLDLAHRVLRCCVHTVCDDLTVQAAIVDVLASARDDGVHRPAGSARHSTEVMHRRLVMETCELLHVASPELSLIELSRAVAASPFHLSKVFHRITGMTISQYRIRLRVHEALDRISRGEDDLSTIAVSAGFSDHSHMTRTVVAQLGHTPTVLRKLLTHPAARHGQQPNAGGPVGWPAFRPLTTR